MANSEPTQSPHIFVSEQNTVSETLIDHKEPIVHTTAVPSLSEYEYGRAGRLLKGKSSLRNRFCFFLSLILGVGWLGPIAYLLLVNLRGDIIGAAAWCPVDRWCNIISYEYQSNVTTATLTAKYDVDNHNLLGTLQFVAKALEVWYIYIAASLVWYITVLLARRPGGLPIGYLLTHMEFGDLRALLDPLLYRSAGGQKGRRRDRHSHTFHLRMFVLIAIAMCLLANLMGPSIAVLLIPTLFWNTSPPTPAGQFSGLLGSEAPSGADAIPGCSAEELQAGFWNCTTNNYAYSLDAFIMTVTQELEQSYDTPDNPGDALTYISSNTAKILEQSIPFSLNFSVSENYNKSSDTVWSLSRQTLRDLSSDFEGLYSVVLGNTTNQTLLDQYASYNSSLDLVLQRYGPLIGTQFFLSGGDLSVTEVAGDQQIRCYSGFSSSTGDAKCMRTGPGWNTSTAISSFVIDQNATVNMTVEVTAYWSDKATYPHLVQGVDACFPNGTAPGGCDYEAIFDSTETALDDGDRTRDIFVTEWRLPGASSPQTAWVMEFFPFYGFATYSIDVTQIWPQLSPASVPNPPDILNTQPLVMHPAWYLAAWGVGEGGNVPPFSDRGYWMEHAVVGFLADPSRPQWALDSFLWYSLYAIGQATSLLPYTTAPATAAAAADPASLPAFQPLLWSGVYNQVWGWNIGSRTAKLGLGVCAFGALTVLLRTILLVVTRITERSSLELITTAIEHSHQGELATSTNEIERSRLRYQLLENDEDESMRLMHIPHD